MSFHHIANRTKKLPPLRVGIGGPVGALVTEDQFGDRFIGAAVVEHDHAGEIEYRNAMLAQLGQLALDPHPQCLTGRTSDQVRVQTRYRTPHHGGHIDRERHDIARPRCHLRTPSLLLAGGADSDSMRAGRIMPICEPGK